MDSGRHRAVPTRRSLAVVRVPLTWAFSSLRPVKPQTRVRVALIVIAIAIIIGVVAAIVGNWFVVVTMVLAILGQVVSVRANWQRFGGRRAG
jgi:hypothetical protein